MVFDLRSKNPVVRTANAVLPLIIVFAFLVGVAVAALAITHALGI